MLRIPCPATPPGVKAKQMGIRRASVPEDPGEHLLCRGRAQPPEEPAIPDDAHHPAQNLGHLCAWISSRKGIATRCQNWACYIAVHLQQAVGEKTVITSEQDDVANGQVGRLRRRNEKYIAWPDRGQHAAAENTHQQLSRVPEHFSGAARRKRVRFSHPTQELFPLYLH